MRIILFFSILFLLSCTVFAQLSGSGTFGDPWSGTLDGDMTWSGTKYIGGDITVDNEVLTISPGAVIVFVAANVDLKINGTGSLRASGAPGNMITFTADFDDDGNYGESGERWGHIWFNAPSEDNASVINYCIIEYGDVHSFTDYNGYGGAIHANFTNLTVSNCILRHNYAYWGGAIFVNQDRSPIINNCYIYNNKSSRGGGGVYCWNRAGSVITNCIFDSNQCLEPSISYYTGGGVAAQTNTSVKIINCTFVNNTSTRPEGKALLFHSCPNARVINSIFWGSDEKQIYFYGTSASNLVNSAYRGITASSGSPVQSIILSSSNNAPDGPNFSATDGSDWSIMFVSPCRDAGANSYTGVTIPGTDYAGNSRIYNVDIGAYEVQYSRWRAEPYDKYTWTAPGNWEQGVYPGHPLSTGDIIIPFLASSASAPEVSYVTIPADRQMILEPGAKVSISTLINNGTLFIRSNASQRSSLITDSYSGNDAIIEIHLSGGGNEDEDNFKWHYISSPVTSLSTDVFTGTTPDLAQFVESRPVMSLMQGWVAYDGYVYSTGLMNGPTFNTLTTGTNGKGYNYFDYSDHLFTFQGQLNSSDVTAPLGFSGNPSLHGFNLLGNPFISGLDWDVIANDPEYPANTSKGLYFTRDNTQCTYIGGVGIPGDVTGIIPPMQGFFTKTYSTDNSIVLSTAARTHDNIHTYYKGGITNISLVRLTLQETNYTDETVVRFNNNAKTGLDIDFDMEKMIMSETKTQIYTSLDGINYAINGQPFPETLLEIPVVINVTSSGSHSINATQIQALAGYNVKLKDVTAGVTTDLKINPEYVFSSEKGKITGRFILLISDINTGIETGNITSGQFSIYVSGGIINIIPLEPVWNGMHGAVNIIDLNGRIITSVNKTEYYTGVPIQVRAPEQTGIYFVNLKAGLLRHTAKVFINQ